MNTRTSKRTKITTKFIAVACSLTLLCAFFTGCQKTETAQAPSFDVQDIKIDCSGYTVGVANTLRFAFVAINPNIGHLAKNAVFSIEAFDTKNNSVGTAGVTIPVMYPEAECASAGTITLQSPASVTDGSTNTEGGPTTDVSTDTAASELSIAYIQISPLMDSVDWSDTTYSNDQLNKEISIENSRLSAGSDKKLSISADITTEINKNVDAVAVALIYDAEGNPVCGSDADQFKMDKDNSAKIDLEIYDAPEYTDCYIFIMPQTIL